MDGGQRAISCRVIEAYASPFEPVRVEIKLPGHTFVVQEVVDGPDEVSCSCGVTEDKQHESLATLAVAALSLSMMVGKEISISCYSHLDRFSVVVDNDLELVFDSDWETYDAITDSKGLLPRAVVVTGMLMAGVKETLRSFFELKDFGGVGHMILEPEATTDGQG